MSLQFGADQITNPACEMSDLRWDGMLSTDFSFEAFDSAYHALEGFDGFLGVLTGVVSILFELVRRSLNGAKLALYVLLSGTKDLAVVLVRNLIMTRSRPRNREKRRR